MKDSNKIMLFKENTLDLRAIEDDRTIELLKAAINRTSDKMRPSDLLASAIESGDPKILTTLSQALEPGATPRDLKDIIDVYNPASKSGTDFNGTLRCFSHEMLEALKCFEEQLQENKGNISNVILEMLFSCVLQHLDEEDKENLTILDVERGVEIFNEHIKMATEPLTPLFDTASDRLRSEEFSQSCWAIMENSCIRAADLGYERVLPPHCFLALLNETEGVTEHIVRLQTSPEIGPGKVAEIVSSVFRLGDRRNNPVELDRNGISEAAVELLRTAQKGARLWSAEQIDAPHLLLALIERMPPRLASVLKRSPLDLDIGKLREHLDQYLRESKTQTKQEVAFRLPSGLLRSEDLTYRSRTNMMMKAVKADNKYEENLEALKKALYRRTNNHGLVTGLRGVGKTTLVWELARSSATGEIPFLKRKRFLWVDCQDVAPEESKDKLDAIISHVAGRTDLIVVLDGLGTILRSPSGANNKLILRAALKDSRIHLIGVLSSADFNDLLSSDNQMLEFFTRVDVDEPEVEDAIQIIRQKSVELENEYKVVMEDKAIERTVRLSAEYIMNERLPAKAIKILRRVCEDLDYDRTQKRSQDIKVTVPRVIKVISEISSVPEATLSGIGEGEGLGKTLRDDIKGQDEAIEAVLNELRLIKAGLSDPGKPATVMFFAGLTGVGKTELAKKLAEIYSSSKKLQTYTMGNFTESHSISGIIGVPPGYVGHEQGGRLINDLNSDPYSVFLFDEAEKADPDIWKPFLNLFDEGWIVDQRGTKAFADKAIFILTSNAGHEDIAKMSQAGEKMETIIDEVKKKLSTIRHERTNRIVFPPEFLARIKRIVVFKPLDKDAMIGICNKLIGEMQETWREKREKEIDVPSNLKMFIAEQSDDENRKSGGKEGGRIVKKKLSELIESRIQNEASKRETEYKSCNKIELVFLSPGKAMPHQPAPKPKIDVRFCNDKPQSPSECVIEVKEKLRQYCGTTKDVGESMNQVLHDCAVQLEAVIEDWKRDHSDYSSDDEATKFLSNLKKLNQEIEKARHGVEETTYSLVKCFISDWDNQD